MPSVALPSVILLSVVRLSVIMCSVIKPIVVAPFLLLLKRGQLVRFIASSTSLAFHAGTDDANYYKCQFTLQFMFLAVS